LLLLPLLLLLLLLRLLLLTAKFLRSPADRYSDSVAFFCEICNSRAQAFTVTSGITSEIIRVAVGCALQKSVGMISLGC